MSFQAYIDTVEKNTGKTIAELTKLATEKGFVINGLLSEGTKAGQIIAWLKEDFDLGHGHAMSVFAYFKGKRD